MQLPKFLATTPVEVVHAGPISGGKPLFPKVIRSFVLDESGQGTIEYPAMLALAAIIVLFAFKFGSGSAGGPGGKNILETTVSSALILASN